MRRSAMRSTRPWHKTRQALRIPGRAMRERWRSSCDDDARTLRRPERLKRSSIRHGVPRRPTFTGKTRIRRCWTARVSRALRAAGRRPSAVGPLSQPRHICH
jgi:hypothetical protein